eukprot:1392143-Pleurochrysis_carterae.AAC.1
MAPSAPFEPSLAPPRDPTSRKACIRPSARKLSSDATWQASEMATVVLWLLVPGSTASRAGALSTCSITDWRARVLARNEAARLAAWRDDVCSRISAILSGA